MAATSARTPSGSAAAAPAPTQKSATTATTVKGVAISPLPNEKGVYRGRRRGVHPPLAVDFARLNT
jgi:hypothetical protein